MHNITEENELQKSHPYQIPQIIQLHHHLICSQILVQNYQRKLTHPLQITIPGQIILDLPLRKTGNIFLIKIMLPSFEYDQIPRYHEYEETRS